MKCSEEASQVYKRQKINDWLPRANRGGVSERNGEWLLMWAKFPSLDMTCLGHIESFYKTVIFNIQTVFTIHLNWIHK